jgi:drug/metabolite transporter (DMT)-like permease
MINTTVSGSSKSTKGLLWVHVALFFSSLLASAQYSAVKVIIPEYISALGFLSIRIPIAMAFFFIFKHLRTKETVRREDWGIFMLCALFGVVINQTGYFKGMELTTPIHGAIIMTFCPIAVFLLNLLVNKQRLRWLQALGIGIGFVGVLLLLLGKVAGRVSEAVSMGNLLVFVNALSYSLFLVIQKRIAHKYHPFTIVAYLFLVGGVLIVPWGVPSLAQVNWEAMPAVFWWVAGFILFFTTIFAYLINTWALSKVEPQVVGAYVYLQPVLAAAIAVYSGKDVLSCDKILCGLLIVLGVYLVGYRKS